MDQHHASVQRSAMPSTRVLALFALGIVIVLGCWRAADIFTQPEDEWLPVSAVETSLLGILEPVAGKGNIRLSVGGDGRTGQSVLILLSSDARDAAPTIERLASSAVMLTPAAGDQLIIEEADFARGIPGRPTLAGWIELSLYGILCSLLGWMGLRPQPVAIEPAGRSLAVRQNPPVEFDGAGAASLPRKPSLLPAAEPDAAASLARKDPARTATILRSWMRGEGDVA